MDVGDRGRQLGVAAGIALGGLGLSYGVVLAFGLGALRTPTAPIGEPWFSLMEIHIVLIAPALVVLMAALQAGARPARPVLGRLAIGLMTAAAVLTAGVHLTVLLGGFGDDHSQAFRWPSTAYWLDIVAWDGFFALAVLAAAPLPAGRRLAPWCRGLLAVSGLLALAGWIALPLGDLRWRLLGVAGYAGVFPIAAVLLAVLWHRARGAAAA